MEKTKAPKAPKDKEERNKWKAQICGQITKIEDKILEGVSKEEHEELTEQLQELHKLLLV